MTGRDSQPFIDPGPGLRKDYEAAVEQLSREMGNLKTLSERWQFWRRKRRLWRDLVVRPGRSAHW